jgi:hypothetical protein
MASGTVVCTKGWSRALNVVMVQILAISYHRFAVTEGRTNTEPNRGSANMRSHFYLSRRSQEEVKNFLAKLSNLKAVENLVS